MMANVFKEKMAALKEIEDTRQLLREEIAAVEENLAELKAQMTKVANEYWAAERAAAAARPLTAKMVALVLKMEKEHIRVFHGRGDYPTSYSLSESDEKVVYSVYQGLQERRLLEDRAPGQGGWSRTATVGLSDLGKAKLAELKDGNGKAKKRKSA